MDKATAYAQGFRYLPNGLASGPKSLEPLGVDRNGFPANVKSLGSTVGDTSFSPLADKVTLEFRKAGHHIEHKPSGWRSQIEAVAEANEGNTESFEFTKSRNQVFE